MAKVRWHSSYVLLGRITEFVEDLRFWHTRRAAGMGWHGCYRSLRTASERREWRRYVDGMADAGFGHRTRRSPRSIPDSWDDYLVSKANMRSWKALDRRAGRQWARRGLEKLLAKDYEAVE